MANLFCAILLSCRQCVKTILDLKLLDVGYDRQRLTFVQVRNDLAARVGDNAAMVPTLELSDGTHLSDSWMIAIYLASHHSRGSALFPFPSSRPFAASLNVWGKTGLAPHLVPLTRPAISACLDGESHEYFENVKVGKAKMDKFRALAYNERQHLVQACVNALEPIQAALAAVLEAQNSSTSLMAAIAHASSPLWLEGSQEPTHADFCVFGWYGECRLTSDTLYTNRPRGSPTCLCIGSSPYPLRWPSCYPRDLAYPPSCFSMGQQYEQLGRA